MKLIRTTPALYLISSIVLVLSSCTSQQTKDDQELVYYDVRHFVTQQIALLNEHRPMTKKWMKVGAQEEVSTTKTIDWQKELELFVKADLNKPVNRLLYTVKESATQLNYSLKSGEDEPVQLLKITLDSLSGNPLRIEATVRTHNQLYQSQKKLRMECGPVKGIWRVVSYEINGFQELAITERKTFEVRSSIQW